MSLITKVTWVRSDAPEPLENAVKQYLEEHALDGGQLIDVVTNNDGSFTFIRTWNSQEAAESFRDFIASLEETPISATIEVIEN